MTIKPYYSEPGIEIYHGDCRDILPHLPKVDLVLTDPPYDIFTHRGAMTKDGSSFGVSFSEMRDIPGLVGLLLDRCDKWSIVFCSLEMLGSYQAVRPENYVRGGVWDRIINAPQLSGDRPAQGAEGIAILNGRTGRMRWNGGGSAAIWRAEVERGRKLHPTQKPLNLFTDLIGKFSQEGETVLDPYMGSGTTLVAARQLSRRAIGIEIEKKYCDIAIDRLRQEVLPLNQPTYEKHEQGEML